MPKQVQMDAVSYEAVRGMIFVIRGQSVMIDRDLAHLYEVPTKRLNEQVKRNIKRFPKDFMFPLSMHETSELVANCDRLKKVPGTKRGTGKGMK